MIVIDIFENMPNHMIIAHYLAQTLYTNIYELVLLSFIQRWWCWCFLWCVCVYNKYIFKLKKNINYFIPMLATLTRALTSSIVVVAGKSLSASRRIRSPACDDDMVLAAVASRVTRTYRPRRSPSRLHLRQLNYVYYFLRARSRLFSYLYVAQTSRFCARTAKNHI